MMFSGEAFLLIIFHVKMRNDPTAKARHEQNKASPFLFAIPATLDSIASFLNFMGLIHINASSYQMLKMLCMVFIVLLSVTVLRKRYSLI